MSWEPKTIQEVIQNRLFSQEKKKSEPQSSGNFDTVHRQVFNTLRVIRHLRRMRQNASFFISLSPGPTFNHVNTERSVFLCDEHKWGFNLWILPVVSELARGLATAVGFL